MATVLLISLTMSQPILAATLIALLSSAGALSAQQPPAKPTSENSAPDSITLKGCVAESMGRYMLKDAVIVKPVPAPAPAGVTEPVVTPPATDQVYGLIGPQVSAHVGHQIEVVGTMPPNARSGNAQASQDPERTAHPMAGTVNVKTVTMLASTCR